MLRKFTPKYTFNIFNREDIDELNNLTLYASGLIIKDELTAEEAETDTSLRLADRYVRAVEGTLKDARSFEINAIIKNYTETNKYYRGLQDLYNIPPYVARKAKDREIITSLNSSALPLADQSLFQKCYYETLNYYKNVTYTKAFSNQDYDIEFFNWYLVFSSILKYMNAKMEKYFDVDTYDELKLKNGFISWGLDYFDDFPTTYKRKVYKAMNDLVRSKGTNEVFLKIRNIFQFAGLNIHKYYLGKNKENSNLVFYKTPIDEQPDFKNNKKVAYEDLTDDDPYWRADKEDILDEDFNPAPSKYISVDTIIDLMDNNKKLSYLVTFLNEIIIYNENLIRTPMLRDKSLTREEALSTYGILDDSFNFRNSKISTGKIKIFDALVALIVLVMKRMNWDETIHRKLVIPRVYQYTSQNLTDVVKKARNNLYWSRKRYKESVWKSMMDLLNEFKIKTFSNFNQIDLKEVLDMFESSSVYARQLKFVADYSKDDVIPTKLDQERYFDVLEYTMNSVLHNVTDLKLSTLHMYIDLQDLLTKFVGYELTTGYLTEDDIYKALLVNNDLLKDISVLVTVINRSSLQASLDKYRKNPTVDTARLLFLNLEATLEQLISQDKYKGRVVVDNYTTLSPYLNIFLSNIKKKEREIFSIKDFLSSYYYNENLRSRLENFILQAEDPEIYNSFLDLWENSYVSSYHNDMMKGYNTFSDYLMNNDAELYMFTQIKESADYDYEPDYSKQYRDKIIELTESLSTYLDLNEELLIQNNFIGITTYIKDYMNILITIFKSFTTQTTDSSNNFTFDNEFDNFVRVTDSFQMNLSTLSFLDVIEVSESYQQYVKDEEQANDTGDKGEDDREEVRRETFYKLTNSADVPGVPREGGRNLLVKTNQGKTNWSWRISSGGTTAEDYDVDGVKAVKLTRTTSASASWDYIQYDGLIRKLIEPNTKYTLSFDVKPSVDVTFSAVLERGDGGGKLTNAASMNKATANKWTKVSCVLTSKTTLPDDLSQVVYLANMPTVKDNDLIIKNIKLEKSESHTPYSEAPEDLGWSTNELAPTQSQRYLWKFYYIYYSDGSVKISQPINLSIAGVDCNDVKGTEPFSDDGVKVGEGLTLTITDGNTAPIIKKYK